VVRLRLPDTGLADHEQELSDILAEQCAGFEVCLAPWEGDAHADHEAAGRAARRAAAGRADRADLSGLDVALGRTR
jgi:LmbE family N-acetylglucosaminyl deacetylase